MTTRIFRFAFALAMLALGGCATQLNSVFRRPIVENSLEAGTRALSVDATRRSIILETDETGKLLRLCAEPPPDVADKITAALELGIDASAAATTGADKTEAGLKATSKDNFTLDAVKLYDRAVVADVFRTAGYTLCQYYLNGAIDGKQLAHQYEELLTKTFDALKQNPGRSQVPATDPQASNN